jgi:hypothetical protein
VKHRLQDIVCAASWMLALFPSLVLAHQPRLVTGSLVEITNPEVPQAFYSEIMGRRPLQKGERLADRILTQLAEMARRPAPVRSFFKFPSIAYIAVCCINGWITM